MSKDKKQPHPPRSAETGPEIVWPPLTDLEAEVSLVCLRFFRGDWDQYLDYLTGPRGSEVQRRRELPVVQELKERDRLTDYLTASLEDEVAACVERLDFDGLYRLWELCWLLNPNCDPFPSDQDHPLRPGQPAEEPPTSLH
jgi:hypothetical protein